MSLFLVLPKWLFELMGKVGKALVYPETCVDGLFQRCCVAAATHAHYLTSDHIAEIHGAVRDE